MLRFVPLLLLVALAAACGGSLSVEEYEEWCRESAAEYTPFADGNSWHEATSQLDLLLEDAQGIEPPQELLGYHDASITAIADLKAVVEAFDPDATVNVFQLIDALVAATGQFQAASDQLPGGLRRGIEDAGCIAVAEPEALQHQ